LFTTSNPIGRKRSAPVFIITLNVNGMGSLAY